MTTWYEQAESRLKDGYDKINGWKEREMKPAVRDALLEFCRQNEEFAQAVVDLYGDPNRCRLISGATQVYMREHFSLDAVWNCVKDDFKR